jgi:hypothetical protein
MFLPKRSIPAFGFWGNTTVAASSHQMPLFEHQARKLIGIWRAARISTKDVVQRGEEFLDNFRPHEANQDMFNRFMVWLMVLKMLDAYDIKDDKKEFVIMGIDEDGKFLMYGDGIEEMVNNCPNLRGRVGKLHVDAYDWVAPDSLDESSSTRKS